MSNISAGTIAAGALCAAALCAATPAGAAAAPTYVVDAYAPEEFEPYAIDINNSGHIIGFHLLRAPHSDDPVRAWFWSNGRQFQGIGGIAAVALNDADQAIGNREVYGMPGPTAWLWADGERRSLGTLGGPVSVARGINNAGQVVGYSSVSAFDYRAFVYQDGAMRNLGTLGGPDSVSGAAGINDRGQIVGEYTDERYNRRAFLYENGAMRDLGTLGGDSAWATAIGNGGHVLGTSANAAGYERHFIYHDGTMRELALPDGVAFEARDINALGDVVGVAPAGAQDSAYLWSDGELVDLAGRVDPKLGWRIQNAAAINDKGQIAAVGCRRDCVAVVLTPVPEPATAAMLAGGLAVLAGIGRRRAGRAA